MASLQLRLTSLLWLTVLTGQIIAWPIHTDQPTDSDEKQDEADGEVSNGGAKAVSLKELLEENKLDEEDQDQVQDDDDDNEGDLCPLCRDDFLENPSIDIQCGHKYHLDCLELYDGRTNRLEKCFLCFKEMRTKDGRLLVDMIDEHQQMEVVRNKLKIGVLAGYRWRPKKWETTPRRWSELGLYW